MQRMHRYYGVLGIAGIFLLSAVEAHGQERKGVAERFDTNGLARVEVNGRAFYIDTLGNRVFDAYADPNQPSAWDASDRPDRFIVLKDGLSGMRSTAGEWIMKPQYQQIEAVLADCWKVTKDGKQTFLGASGEQLPYFDEVGYLDGRYFDVKTEGKWGVYDRERQQLAIPAVYDGFDYCGGCGRKSDYLYAQQNGKWGIVDFQNNVLVPFLYEHSHWNGMRSDVWVRSFSKEGKSVVVHIPTGREFAADGREQQEILGGGELVVQSNGKYGLVDTLCREVLPTVYDRIVLPNANDYLGYHGPYAIVEQAGKKGVYASGRGLIIQPQWEEIGVYDDYFALAREGQYGLYDSNGRELIPPRYTDITHINDYFYSSGGHGLALFRTKQKALHGVYFVETGKEIPPKFHEIDMRSLAGDGNNRVIVGEYLGEEAVFDLDGHELIPLGYDAWEQLDTASNRYFTVRKTGRWGLYDAASKKEVIPTAFDGLRMFPGSADWLLVITDEDGESQYGVYSLAGEELLPPTFRSYSPVNPSAGLFSEDHAGGKAVVVDGRTGQKTALPTRYAHALPHTHLVMIADDATQARLYNPFEKKIVNDLVFSFPYRYTDDSHLATLHDFAPNGRAWVYVKGQYGLMDTTGRWIKKPLYDQALNFSGNGIAVGAKAFPRSDWRSSAGYTGYQFIGADGQPVTNRVYTGPSTYLVDFDYFVGDYLVIREVDTETGGLAMGLADTAGNVIVAPAYDAVEALNGTRYFLLQKNRKFGVADASGSLILPVVFDNLLINRYDQEAGITFPLLGYQSGEWKYYTRAGDVLEVEHMGKDAWSVSTSLW